MGEQFLKNTFQSCWKMLRAAAHTLIILSSFGNLKIAQRALKAMLKSFQRKTYVCRSKYQCRKTTIEFLRCTISYKSIKLSPIHAPFIKEYPQTKDCYFKTHLPIAFTYRSNIPTPFQLACSCE